MTSFDQLTDLESIEESLAKVLQRRIDSKLIENLTQAINNLNYTLLTSTETDREISRARLLKQELNNE